MDAGVDAPPVPADATRIDIDVTLDRYTALRKRGQIDDAVAVMREAIDRANGAEAAALRFELGRYLLSIGRTDAGRAELALVSGPGVPPELVAAARALVDGTR